ncbi:SseB family protein [Rubrimonas sp.]|uniref:SseB family protein n=1 Tax=Rubrimonas sp. TaxID=2036015 RepID=UPI002FDCB435
MTCPDLTPLDRAWAEAEAEGAPESARARFFALLLETRLLVPVTPTPDDAPLAPLTFELEEGAVALAFDDDARMAAFFDAPVEYVALPGAGLMAALAEAGLGLGLNLGEAPSAALFRAPDVAFVAAEAGGALAASTLSGALRVGPPLGASEAMLAALAERVAALPGLVAEAWLVRLAPGVGAGEGAGALTLLLTLPPSARRAGEGIAALLGRAAQPFAPDGESVAVGLLDPDHGLSAPARAQGVGLHPAPLPTPPSALPSAPAPRPTGPPRLR